ncbi:hypothetical protein ACS5NO_28485 [Larkinella sp. GY13]|uniref:hypothetical protein n=1 Tax=Larkinella sp. GY13 TaxID=3453720 RepID=UPI003EE97B1E
MAFVYFSCCNPMGTYQECSLGAENIDFCLEGLSCLVKNGWQLDNIRLSDYTGNVTWLPVEAFDGESIERPLQVLQQEWEEILFNNK